MYEVLLCGFGRGGIHLDLTPLSYQVDFDNNHPTLSAEMRNAWREVWPGCMDVVDMRMAVAYYDTVGGEQQPLLHPL